MNIYADLDFPAPPIGRPYVFVNMVTTIDGKSVTGTRDEGVEGLGSATDRQLMKRIEAAADAVLVGAQTLRATSPRWNPQSAKRVVVTLSGDLPQGADFFTKGESYVATNGCSHITPFGRTEILHTGEHEVDLLALLHILSSKMGVRRLVVMGGSELNGKILGLDLADELFLTVAPKVKLGRFVPTYAGGEPLPRDQMLAFDLIEHHSVGDELFLRYRRNNP